MSFLDFPALSELVEILALKNELFEVREKVQKAKEKQALGPTAPQSERTNRPNGSARVLRRVDDSLGRPKGDVLQVGLPEARVEELADEKNSTPWPARAAARQPSSPDRERLSSSSPAVTARKLAGFRDAEQHVLVRKVRGREARRSRLPKRQ